MSGELIGIAVRARSRAPMKLLDDAEISEAAGVVSDSRGRQANRQVTILSIEDWTTACDELGKQLPWETRRANLLVQGIALCETTGSVIRIGDTELLVTGETDPCKRMDEIEPGLRKALTPDWRGGVCCRVLRGGPIAAGQVATITNAPA